MKKAASNKDRGTGTLNPEKCNKNKRNRNKPSISWHFVAKGFSWLSLVSWLRKENTWLKNPGIYVARKGCIFLLAEITCLHATEATSDVFTRLWCQTAICITVYLLSMAFWTEHGFKQHWKTHDRSRNKAPKIQQMLVTLFVPKSGQKPFQGYHIFCA